MPIFQISNYYLWLSTFLFSSPSQSPIFAPLSSKLYVIFVILHSLRSILKLYMYVIYIYIYTCICINTFHYLVFHLKTNNTQHINSFLFRCGADRSASPPHCPQFSNNYSSKVTVMFMQLVFISNELLFKLDSYISMVSYFLVVKQSNESTASYFSVGQIDQRRRPAVLKGRTFYFLSSPSRPYNGSQGLSGDSRFWTIM